MCCLIGMCSAALRWQILDYSVYLDKIENGNRESFKETTTRPNRRKPKMGLQHNRRRASAGFYTKCDLLV